MDLSTGECFSKQSQGHLLFTRYFSDKSSCLKCKQPEEGPDKLQTQWPEHQPTDRFGVGPPVEYITLQHEMQGLTSVRAISDEEDV